MARLVVTEQIACPANVEVVAGELETCAETVEIAEHLETFLRDFGQLRILGIGEIGIGAQLGPPDAPAQLVKLGKAEDIRAVDDDRVRAGQVEPAFDDRRGEQDLVLAFVERTHALFDLAWRHLAMRGDELHFGDALMQPVGQFLHVRNPRDDDETLPTAMVLAQQCFAHHHVVPFHHICADREPVDGRGLNGRKLTQAGHGHLQGARDRRGGQGQHVNIRAHRLQTFFVTHAKVLFFINNQQAEVLELDRLCQQRMGADNNIDGAAIDAVAGGCGLFRGDKTRQLTHFKREATEAFGEGFIVLTCQQGRRRNNRHLQP